MPTENTAPTLSQFVKSAARRLWKGDHLDRSVSKMFRFCSYDGYGQKPIDEITANDVYLFMDYIEATQTARAPHGCSENTTNHYVAALSKIFKHAESMGLIAAAPAILWRNFKERERRFLTNEELAQIYEVLAGRVGKNHPWVQHYITIGIQTGMRLSEIRSITSKSVVRKDDGNWIHLKHTKNGDERWVPANGKTLAALEALDFCPDMHFQEHPFYRVMAEVRHHVAPNDSAFVFHALRHTAASSMANELGVNTILIAKLLGHKDLKTTQKYVHAKASELQSVAKAMGGVYALSTSQQ
jgi:integrase